MAKSSELSSHEQRAANLQQQKKVLISKAEEIVIEYLYKHHPFNESDMEETYSTNDNQFKKIFKKFNQYN